MPSPSSFQRKLEFSVFQFEQRRRQKLQLSLWFNNACSLDLDQVAFVILSNAITEITVAKLQACHDVRTEGADTGV
jgi:hypothetical protein